MKIDCQLDYRTILADQAQAVHAVISLSAEKLVKTTKPPVAICAVLDRSGSMTGDPFEQAKKACEMVVKHLGKDDLFGLVIFDDQAQCVFSLQTVADKTALISRIRALQTGGSTNLTAGWMLGRDELKAEPSGVGRQIILLSDGLLNRGPVDPVQIGSIVAQGLESDRVRTAALGFGNDYNEDLLRQVAKLSGGDFFDVDTAEKLPIIFREVLQGLEETTAQNIRLRVQPSDFCERLAQLGDYPSITLPDQRIELTLGDLVSEETRALVLLAELLPIPFIGNRPAASLEGEKLLELEVLWDDIGEKEIKSCRHAQVVRISATQDPAEIKLNEETVAWIAVQRAGKALDEATKAVDADRVEEAKDKLRKALEALRRYKLDSKTADGVKLLQEFLKRIEREGGLTARSRKLSTYSSAYYSKPSSRRAWTSDAATTPEFSEKKSVEEQMKETEDDVEPPVSPS
jgi:Ca-activated chloride channel family protein